MLGIPSGVKIFAYMEACDMRKQFDGLAGLVRQGMGRDPQSGDMYVFANRRADMVKVLFFDQQGFCLLAKRMERQTFKLFSVGQSDCLEMNAGDLANLLRGAEISRQNR
jgi:transposase